MERWNHLIYTIWALASWAQHHVCRIGHCRYIFNLPLFCILLLCPLYYFSYFFVLNFCFNVRWFVSSSLLFLKHSPFWSWTKTWGVYIVSLPQWALNSNFCLWCTWICQMLCFCLSLSLSNLLHNWHLALGKSWFHILYLPPWAFLPVQILASQLFFVLPNRFSLLPF